MKRFLLIAVICSLFISCEREKEDIPDSFNTGTETSFKVNRDYISGTESLKFSITNINDSRCPSDVYCVWEGVAVVTLEIESPVSGTLELNTSENQKDTLGTFSFELIKVAPYPISTEIIELEDYEITLQIDKI